MSNITASPHYFQFPDDSNVQINIVLQMQNYFRKSSSFFHKKIRKNTWIIKNWCQSCWLLAGR